MAQQVVALASKPVTSVSSLEPPLWEERTKSQIVL